MPTDTMVTGFAQYDLLVLLRAQPSTNLVLEQVETDAGAASSLMIFCYFVMGSAGMWLIALEWQDKINVIGVLSTVGGLLSLAYWLKKKAVLLAALDK